MSNKPVAVVTGASGGIGGATARLLAQNGYTVYGLSRKPYESGEVIHISCDVSDEASVSAAFERIYAEAGQVDLLCNNAGYGISGAVEFTSTPDAKALFDVNFFGALNCINAVLPHMRATGGRIINTSSVAGMLFIPFQAFYSATKAATNALTLALANEVRPFGIHVSAIMPGDVRTGFTAARKKNDMGETVYAAQKRSVEMMEHDEQNGMTPDYIAQNILKIAKARRPKPLYTGGGKYKFFIFLCKALPTRLINYLVGKLYA